MKLVTQSSQILIGFTIGVFLVLGGLTVKANWNSNVASGNVITATLWNDIVTKMTDLNTRTGNLETAMTGKQATITCPCGACWDQHLYNAISGSNPAGPEQPLSDAGNACTSFFVFMCTPSGLKMSGTVSGAMGACGS